MLRVAPDELQQLIRHIELGQRTLDHLRQYLPALSLVADVEPALCTGALARTASRF